MSRVSRPVHGAPSVIRRADREDRALSKEGTRARRRRAISAPAWALIGTAAVTLLLLWTGFRTGEWRGVVVTEVQVLVVGLVTWFVLRASEEAG